MGFTHGSYSEEVASSLRGMTTVEGPMLVVGTAPINMGDLSNVNKAQLITSTREAMEYFGGTGDISFTISEALDAALNLFNVKPIIAINVLDPKKHKKSETETNIAVVEGKCKLSKKGIMLSTVKIKKASQSEELQADQYQLSFESTGEVVVEIFNSEILKIEATYDWLDPSMVTKLDIIGGINPNTLERKGLECIDEVFTKYSMIPGTIIAPGYSHEAEVKAILEAKATRINSKYGTIAILDLPDDIKYGEAIQKKKELNFISENLIVCYGKGKNGDKIYHLSTLAAALMGQVDAGNSGVPYESPSNKNLKIQALAYKNAEGQYEELRLDEEQANLLNANGITTAIMRTNGFVLWGNRTSCYQPGGNNDPKDMWIPVKRMFKFLSNTIILNTAQDIDRPMTLARAHLIQNTINVFLAGLVSTGRLLGGRIEFKKEENSLSDMLEGKFKWHIYIGAVLPGETLHFIFEYDPTYQETFVEKMAA